LRTLVVLIAFPALLAVAFCGAARAQASLGVPPGDDAYEHLEHFRSLGLWRGDLETRPVRRSDVAEALAAIRARRGELDGADLRRLEALERFAAGWGDAGGRAAAPGEREDGGVSALWRPGGGLRFAGGPATLDSLTDLDRRLRREGLLVATLDAALGERLTAQLRFTEDYGRLTPAPNSGDWADNLPPDAGAVLDDPSARNDRAVVAWDQGWWDLRLGREDRRWGQGRRGTLFLSENPFPLDGVSFRFRTRWVSGASLLAQTRRGQQPPPLVAGEPYPGWEHESGDAWMAAHRFTLHLPAPFTLGLYEATAWGGRGIDLGYANPAGFLVAITQDIYDRSGTDDKKVVGADLRVDLPPVTLYGEFLLDRLVAREKAEAGGDAAISSFAQLAGLRWANPLGWAGADLDLEYAHLDPQVYFHHDGDLRRAFLTEDRLGEGAVIGHWLGPNADDLFVRLGLPPAAWGRLALSFEQARWGLIDGERGVETGFAGLLKKDKAWITGARAVERVLAASWDWRAPDRWTPGRWDGRLTVARVERSGAWSGDGWQAELRLNWRFDRIFREP